MLRSQILFLSIPRFPPILFIFNWVSTSEIDAVALPQMIAPQTRMDLINWLQLWLACVISGGLAIKAVVYPAQSPSFTNFWLSQMRAFLAIFLTEVEDLKGYFNIFQFVITVPVIHVLRYRSD